MKNHFIEQTGITRSHLSVYNPFMILYLRNMKKRLFSGILLLLLGLYCKAAGPDDIIGIWLGANGKGQIQVYKDGAKYFGKIIWLKEPNGPEGKPKLDKNNPNTDLKSKPLIGSQILRDFVYDDGEWTNGHIYDPENGKEYKSYMKLKDRYTLSLRGYIGFSLLGRTEIWTRIK